MVCRARLSLRPSLKATWRDHGYGMWALYHKDDAFIGEVVVYEMTREMWLNRQAP